MNASDLVTELGHRLNLTGLTLQNGVCRLVFDHSLAIDIEDDGSGQLCFHTVLAPAPQEGRDNLFAALLSAQLFGLETDGAAFGLHPKTNELYLFRSLAVEHLGVDAALNALERFTQQAESWRQRVAALAREATTVAPAAPAVPADYLRA